MPAVGIVLFYAGINGLLAVALSFLVVRQRFATKINLGGGDHPPLERAIRAHGNFIEYAPLILLLMLLLALGGVSPIRLHVIGAALTLGRLLHAWGLSRQSGTSVGRGAGIMLTWLALLSAAIAALVMGISAL